MYTRGASPPCSLRSPTPILIKNGKAILVSLYSRVDQTDENIHLNYPVEMLNNIREGLPPHELKLKLNTIVMLIRNISITEGMCNGT